MRWLEVLAVMLVVSAASGCLNAPGQGGEGDQVADELQWTPSWAILEEAEIRPGTGVRFSPGTTPETDEIHAVCAISWMFADPRQDRYFAGIASHCGMPAFQGPPDCANQRGDMRLPGGPESFAVPVFCDDVLDFSLYEFESDQQNRAHPRMLGFDGPYGFIACSDAVPGDEVHMFGHGIATRYIPGGQARTGTLNSCLGNNDRQDVAIDMMAYSHYDSGSPLLHSDGWAISLAIGSSRQEDYGTLMRGPDMSAVMESIRSNDEFLHVGLALADGTTTGEPRDATAG